MEAGNIPFEFTAEKRPLNILRQFVSVFANKGWLDQTLRIKRRDRKYSIFCSNREFIAYRINDDWGISPGIPGWPVCIIDHNQIIEDSEMSELASNEPSAHDWLHCLANGDFEVILEPY